MIISSVHSLLRHSHGLGSSTAPNASADRYRRHRDENYEILFGRNYTRDYTGPYGTSEFLLSQFGQQEFPHSNSEFLRRYESSSDENDHIRLTAFMSIMLGRTRQEVARSPFQSFRETLFELGDCHFIGPYAGSGITYSDFRRRLDTR